MSMNNNDLYITKDLYLAALIYAKEIKLNSVKRIERIYWFNFLNQQTCKEIQNQFFSKSILVNAKEYAESIRTLKAIIASGGSYG